MSENIILATSVGMSESAADNGEAFSYLLSESARTGYVAVINGKFNIQTPQVFTGLGQFTIRSSEANKIDAGQGPELNYIGLPTDQPLFKFIGCYSHSMWGVDNYGVTINLRQLCKYGINTHVHTGENTYSNVGWQHQRLIINAAADGGACYRMTGSINNSEHRFFRCSGYSGNHIKGVTGISLTSGGSSYTSGTYNDVVLDNVTTGGSYARATITVSALGVVTGITLTAQGRGYTVGNVLKIHAIQASANAGLLTGSGATFTVSSVVSSMNVNEAPFSNLPVTYSGTSRASVANVSSYTPWVIGNSIPTTGTWAVGQHVLNWTPTGGYGTPMAWYCTSAGTFGATNPTFAIVPYDLSGMNLGDPKRGAAWLEIDNPNSVNIEVHECNFGNGAQAVRVLSGGVRIHDTNPSGNSDVDVYANSNVVYVGGWTEQSNRFMFEPLAQTLSNITVENVRIASYPHWYAKDQGFDQRPTEVASFAPIWTKRWRGMKVSNCTIGTDTSTSLPKRVIFYVDVTYPPQVDVTNTYTRKAGTWNDGVHNENYTPNVVHWSGFN